MSKLQSFLISIALTTTVQAQTLSDLAPASTEQAGQKTIEGYWQDTARRILFARDAPVSYEYGR